MSRSHVDVNERRLRPIYDCLDNGSNKKALQEADKVLRKQKGLLCAKALKALALLRLGRHDDSAALLEEVHNQSPTDESTLQAMTMAYRELHRLDLLANMYEKATKANPDNEDLLTALFMAYVRIADYKKQQQTAMTLHRLQPNKNPYYFWAVMSIVMQARNSEEKLAKTMFLPLAERMAQKYISQNKIEAEAEVQLYLLILELQEKWEAGLVLIQSDLGQQYCGELMFSEIKAGELLTKLTRWPEVNLLYKKLLLKDPDQWRFYTAYLDSLFHLVDADWKPQSSSKPESTPDHTIDMAVTFLNSQVKVVEESSESKSHVQRSQYLARLDLQKRVNERSGELPFSSTELIEEYYGLFGGRSCCYADLQVYFPVLLNNQQQLEFLKLHIDGEMTETNATAEPFKDTKELQRHLTAIQLYYCTGSTFEISREQQQGFITNLVTWYDQGLVFGADLLVTDMQHGDPYLLMAASIHCHIYSSTGNMNELWKAAHLLECGLQKSPSNFHFKILLIQLCGRLGAAWPCIQLFESMEVKHIQNDSIGYVVANHVGRLGHLNAAGSLYDNMLRFFTSNQKDTAEYMISAYKFGAFHKIDEFLSFKSRLQHSLQYASATVERLLLDMVMETNSHQRTEQILRYMEIEPQKDRTEWEALRDNRDYNIWLVCNHPLQVVSEETMKESFEEEKAWLRVRNLTVRCLAAAVRMGDNTSNNKGENGAENKEDLSAVLTDLVAQLKDHIHQCQSYTNPAKYPIGGPFRTRLSTYLRLGLVDILAEACQVTSRLHQHVNTTNAIGGVTNEQEDGVKFSLGSKLTDLIQQHKRPLVDSENSVHPEALEDLVLITESLGHVVLMTGVWRSLLKSGRSVSDRRGKKKKDSPAAVKPALSESYQAHLGEMEACAGTLLTTLQDSDLTKITGLLSSLTCDDHQQLEPLKGDSLWRKIEQSYVTTNSELVSFLALKQQYLASLKL